MSTANQVKLIKVCSNDQQDFYLPPKAVEASNVMKLMIAASSSGGNVIKFETIDGETLSLIVNWLIHHKDDPPYVEVTDIETERKISIPDWELQLFDVEYSLLFKLILAADRLNIRHLVTLGCKKVAIMMRCKSRYPEKIRELFNLANDLDPEEIKTEIVWAEMVHKWPDVKWI